MKRKYGFLENINLFLIIFISICFIGCKTSDFHEDLSILEIEDVQINEADKYFRIYDNPELKKQEEKTKFLFVRLYYPHYDNPFCIENILKHCIRVVDFSLDKPTHASIGFSLNDEFYGLTTAGKKDLKIESCLDTSGNGYMKKCNIYKSVQSTYAIKVTEEEYNRAKEIIEMYDNNPKTKYGVMLNFSLAGYGIKRKFFSSEEDKVLGARPQKKSEESFDLTTTSFVCSSFVAHILVNSVESIKDFFIEKKLNTKYIYPSDLPHLPGMIKLFMSTWVDYNIIVEEFINVYKNFIPYFMYDSVEEVDEKKASSF